MSQITVNGQVFEVSRANAAQVAGIARILSTITRNIAKDANAAGDDVDNMVIISSVLGSLTEGQLIELAALSIGCDREFAKEHFDLLWVTDALVTLVEETNLRGVIANFTRLANRLQG